MPPIESQDWIVIEGPVGIEEMLKTSETRGQNSKIPFHVSIFNFGMRSHRNTSLGSVDKTYLFASETKRSGL